MVGEVVAAVCLSRSLGFIAWVGDEAEATRRADDDDRFPDLLSAFSVPVVFANAAA